MEKAEAQENVGWKEQFINAAMLHPMKNEFGDIEDVTPSSAAIHFVCIGWKIIFSIIPPPHYWHGWACFIGALTMIGIVTFVIGEFAGLFGCVLGI